MNQWLAVDDLAAAGLGVEIAGAVLLAQGLLATPAQLVARSVTYPGGNGDEVLGRVEDRAKALVGMWAIAVGFVGQWLAVIVGLGTRSTVDVADSRHVLVAIVFTVGAAVVVVVVWSSAGTRLIKAGLLEVAIADHERRNLGTPVDAATLQAWGKLKWLALEGENPDDYVSRVFGRVLARRADEHRV